MAKKAAGKPPGGASVPTSRLYRIKSKPSALVDTRVVYCGDWHASHYVKVMLDQIFGEIISECEPNLAI